MQKPTIEIVFKGLSSTFIPRSVSGSAIIIMRGTTKLYKEYTSAFDVEADKANFTEANKQYIIDALTFDIEKCAVVQIATADEITTAFDLMKENIQTGFVCIADATADETTALVNYAKKSDAEGGYYKAVVFNATAPNHRSIINFATDKVTFTDARGEQNGVTYLPSLCAILASCNVMRSATYFVCSNLLKASVTADEDVALNEGKLILMNDFEHPRILLGINSKTTLETDETDDLKYIDYVEIMDLISRDIKTVFKDNYLGKVKNSANNQFLFISAINTYLTELANDEILDPEYANSITVDAATQRDALVSAGVSDAANWDDETVKNYTYKRTMFLVGDIKILGSMENLKLTIHMN